LPSFSGAIASGKECPVRDHVRRMIERARPTGSGIGIDGGRDPALRLASEAIRLAHLAAATHMILSATPGDAPAGEPAEPTTARGQTR
jgi:hypothetical protein